MSHALSVFLIIFFLKGCLIAQTPVHHNSEGYFNPWPGYEDRGLLDVARWMLWDRLIKGSHKDDSDSVHFEMIQNDPLFLRDNRSQFSVTWVGHSTLLIQMDGLNILTDPIWSDRASPVSFAGPKRLTPPGLPFEQLPQIDAVIISHNHYDHLDKSTIVKLAKQNTHITFFVPIGVGDFLKDLGVSHHEELDWWQSVRLNGMEFVCTPSQHFSGRSLWDRNETLWCSWAVIGTEHRFYFAGDTGYFPGFKEIGERYGPFDLAAVPIGAYRPRWFMSPVHTSPTEALDVYRDVQAKYFVPIHWGTFDLADEAMTEPLEILQREVQKRGLDTTSIKILKHGQTVVLENTAP